MRRAKLLSFVAVILVLLLTICLLVACSNKSTPSGNQGGQQGGSQQGGEIQPDLDAGGHDHNAISYAYDSDYHWKFCEECHEFYKRASHTFGDWVVERDDAPGSGGYIVKHRSCTVCGYTENIDTEAPYNYAGNDNLDDPHLYNLSQTSEFYYGSTRLGIVKGGKGVVEAVFTGETVPEGTVSVLHYKKERNENSRLIGKNGQKFIISGYLKDEVAINGIYNNDGNDLVSVAVGASFPLSGEIVGSTQNVLSGLIVETSFENVDPNVLALDYENSITYHSWGALQGLTPMFIARNPGRATVTAKVWNGDQVLAEVSCDVLVVEPDTSKIVSIKDALADPLGKEYTLHGNIGRWHNLQDQPWTSFIADETGTVWFAVPKDYNTDTGLGFINGEVLATGRFEYCAGYGQFHSGLQYRFVPSRITLVGAGRANYDFDVSALSDAGTPNVMFLDCELYAKKANEQDSTLLPVQFIYWKDSASQTVKYSFMDNNFLTELDINSDLLDLDNCIADKYYLFTGYLEQNYLNWEHINSPKFILVSSAVPVTQAQFDAAPTAINATDMEVDLYDSAYVHYTFDSDNAFNGKAVSFASSNEAIFTVNTYGKVTAKKVGTANLTITARCGISKTIQVTVKDIENQVSVSSIAFTSRLLEVSVGKTKAPIINVLPYNATLDRNITFESSDTDILRIEDGKLVGVSVGEVVLTATTPSGKTASTKVLVTNPITTHGYSITPAGADPDVHVVHNMEGIYSALYMAGMNHYSQTTIRINSTATFDYAQANPNEKLINVIFNKDISIALELMAKEMLHFDVEVEFPAAVPDGFYAGDNNFDIIIHYTYNSNSATESLNFNLKHLNSFDVVNVKSYIDQTLRTKRAIDFDDFALFSNNNGNLDVQNTEELVYALTNGYLPHFTAANTAAEYYYLKMQAVLREIISTDMTDLMKMKAIYEYALSLPANRYNQYYDCFNKEYTFVNPNTLAAYEYTYYLADTHTYMFDYLESWGSEYGVGDGAIIRIIRSLLALEGIETKVEFPSYMDGYRVYHFMPIIIVNYEAHDYILNPLNDKYIDCSSLYSEVTYAGFMLDASQYGQATIRAEQEFNLTCYRYSDILTKASSVLEAATAMNAQHNKAFGDKQIGSDEYDYLINSPEELTYLFNKVAASGFKGLGYITVRLNITDEQGNSVKYENYYVDLADAMFASNANFVNGFGLLNAFDFVEFGAQCAWQEALDMNYKRGGFVFVGYKDYALYNTGEFVENCNSFVIRFNIA